MVAPLTGDAQKKVLVPAFWSRPLAGKVVMRKMKGYLVIFLLVFLVGGGVAYSSSSVDPIRFDTPIVRVKDVARIQGVRDNQIYGLGLVIGLDGTGDGSGSLASVQMMANMLEHFGITVSAEQLRLRNVAAVMVTADIPTSLRMGDRIDVTLSSIGDAKSLQGGFLLQTPLEAANGQIYAVAQGPLSIGGFNLGGGGGAVQRNHPTIGRIANGAIIEQEVPSGFTDGETLNLILHEPDFTTAFRLAEVINQAFPLGPVAWAVDQAMIRVVIPFEYRPNIVGFIARLEELPLRPDAPARVIVNERTGTVVMGEGVRIATVAISHGNLSVRVMAPGSAEERSDRVLMVEGGASVSSLVEALNAIGATPRDIIAILQSIKAAGALFGELLIL